MNYEEIMSYLNECGGSVSLLALLAIAIIVRCLWGEAAKRERAAERAAREAERKRHELNTTIKELRKSLAEEKQRNSILMAEAEAEKKKTSSMFVASRATISRLEGQLKAQEQQIRNLRLEDERARTEIKELKQTVADKNEDIRSREIAITKKTEECENLRQTLAGTEEIGKMITDFRSSKTVEGLSQTVKKIIEEYINAKLDIVKEKAPSATKEVEALRKRVADICCEHTLLKQYHDRVLQTFPELENYIDGDTEINTDEADEESSSDRVKRYLDPGEYNSMGENERNQLALERYLKNTHRKNNWIVGVEYEMSYSHALRRYGFDVEENGATNGLNDLGRDIIAKSRNGITYIIQCKRLAPGRRIHENVICQLIGTTWHYIVTNNAEAQNVRAALVTTAELSETAKKIAEQFGIKIRRREMTPYPAIKCNINKGNRIYHLPFDPQYWRTKIDHSSGEFYAWTVAEAVGKEFRRARKN